MIARLVLLLLAPALLTGAAPAVPEARPALWRIADADTTIWLVGTVHALPPGLVWRAGRLAEALDGAESLIVEMVPPDDPATLGATMARLGLPTAPLPPLAERVDADKRDALAALVGRTGLPAGVLDGMKTWFAAVALMGPLVVESGADPASGLDRMLIADARRRGLAVDGLETVEQQFGFFDALPEAEQRAFLAGVVEDAPTARDQFARMIEAWATGDVAGLAAFADEDMGRTPGLRDALLTSRNRSWAAALKARLDRPGIVLVAVGAAHLVGDGSVQQVLAAEGVVAERVQ